jgi:hypothetical protein
MKQKYNNPFSQGSQKPTPSKKSKKKPRLLECGDIYMLRTDSKKKALTVLQSKLHSERKNLPRMTLRDYDESLAEATEYIKETFGILETSLKPKSKLKKVIKKKKWRDRGRKVRLGLFAKMLEKVKKDAPVRNIGIPKLEGISSK